MLSDIDGGECHLLYSPLKIKNSELGDGEVNSNLRVNLVRKPCYGVLFQKNDKKYNPFFI